MPVYDDVITGRDALHRLDTLTSGARAEIRCVRRRRPTAILAAARISPRMKAEGYRQLARDRGSTSSRPAPTSRSTRPSQEAERLLAEHEAFIAAIGGEVGDGRAGAAATLKPSAAPAAGRCRRRAATPTKRLTAKVEKEVQSIGYLALKQGFEDSQSRCPSRRAEARTGKDRPDRVRQVEKRVRQALEPVVPGLFGEAMKVDGVDVAPKKWWASRALSAEAARQEPSRNTAVEARSGERPAEKARTLRAGSRASRPGSRYGPRSRCRSAAPLRARDSPGRRCSSHRRCRAARAGCGSRRREPDARSPGPRSRRRARR